jgi:hypothetical protein
MKAFIWLLTVALSLVCLTGWAMSELIEHSIRDTMRGMPLPYFTGLVIFPHGWLLGVPAPWIVYSAILTFRREVTPGAALLFAGTLIVIAAVVASALTIALTLPYIPRRP